VLDALLENAVRANQGDAAKCIRIELIRVEERRARVRFHDDGPGVDEDMRTRLFTYGASGAPGGHGFGLYMVRRTLQRFGGSIELDAAATSGACFHLDFDVLVAGVVSRDRALA
jgi:signal transduction histidine kinase